MPAKKSPDNGGHSDPGSGIGKSQANCQCEDKRSGLRGKRRHPRFDPADNPRADEDHDHREHDCFARERPQFDPLHALALCQSIDHGEQQHPQDVVEHGRT